MVFGCTVTEWPKDTIVTGGTGEIKVTFNTDGKIGRQLRIIRVETNCNPPEIILQMGGEIKVNRKKRKRG